MLHKISQFCDKVDGLKRDADRLRELKYGKNKGSTIEIDNLIAQIQADCFLLANDRSSYRKPESED